MKLSEYLNVELLEGDIRRGMVSANHHPTLPLTLYCYTRKAVAKDYWTDVTKKCRGLIVCDIDGEVISRPFIKFFGYHWLGQIETYPGSVLQTDKQFGPPIITEKINGNLGIFWRYGIHWGIASKGSFSSDHAKWAEKWMADHIENYGPLVFPEGYTPVFEMICQEVQEHCIKYDKDELKLLAFINNETGEELNYRSLWNYASLSNLAWAAAHSLTFEEALNSDRPGHEGYVATYNRPGQPPLKIKIKHPSFIKARKEFYAKQELTKLQNNPDPAYAEVFDKASGLVLEALARFTTRKEIGVFFTLPENLEFSQTCFAILDCRDHKPAIHRLLAKRLQESQTSTISVLNTKETK
jgi:RNA ligase